MRRSVRRQWGGEVGWDVFHMGDFVDYAERLGVGMRAFLSHCMRPLRIPCAGKK